MRELAGSYDAGDIRVALAATRFNATIVERLVEGAVDGLSRHGIGTDRIALARCPGSWELPLVCRRLARTGEYQAIIALGCVIRGDTPHFDYVCAECSKGIAHVGMECDLPIIFGVLTTDTVDQAMDRAGIKSGNKGFDAALAAIEMVNLLRAIG